MSSVTYPALWKSSGNSSQWKIVNQSVHGKHFWQVNYNTETNLFDLVYNVNQDIEKDKKTIISYYLGPTPPLKKNIQETLKFITSFSQSIENIYKRNKDRRTEYLVKVFIDTTYLDKRELYGQKKHNEL